MSVHLKEEFETVVFGEDGMVIFSQTTSCGESLVLCLSVHQFQRIVQSEKALIREALEAE